MLLVTTNRYLSIIFKAIELTLRTSNLMIHISEAGPSLTKWVWIDLWVVSSHRIDALLPTTHFKSSIRLTEFFHLKVDLYFLIYYLIYFQ